MTSQEFEKILNIGIALTGETDSNTLLNSIVRSGMEITHCDAATLYLYEDGVLKFRIMKTLSIGISLGENGEPITDVPPVEYKEENICAYTAIHRSVVNIPDAYHSPAFDFSGPKKYDEINGYRTKSMLVIPLENNSGELLGVFQMINAMDEEGNVIPFDKQYEIIIRSLGSLAAIELQNLQYVEEIKAQQRSFVEAMATAIDERTPYNGCHTRNVAQYALLVAEKINERHDRQETQEFFSEERREKIELAALLHDIGKMVVPRSIMNRTTRLSGGSELLKARYKLLNSYYEIDFLKGRISKEDFERETEDLEKCMEFIRSIDGAEYLTDEDLEEVSRIGARTYTAEDGEVINYLTDEEMEQLSVRKGTLTAEDRRMMESHVDMTSKILSKVHFHKRFEDVPRWAGEHHEFLNGTGYPLHLKGEALDLETRILTVCDIYDALTARNRPYRTAISIEKACGVLESMVSEGKLDGWIVELLTEAVKERGLPAE